MKPKAKQCISKDGYSTLGTRHFEYESKNKVIEITYVQSGQCYTIVEIRGGFLDSNK